MFFVLYGIVFFLLLISIRKKDTNQKNALFSKAGSNMLKGFSAILVILHHLGQQFKVNNYDSLNINGNIGGIAVGIFFMLSAYGLIKASKNNENYYKKIFLVKIPALYAFQVSMNTLYYLLFFKASNLKISEILLRIFNLDIFFSFGRLNGYSWFITTILFVYLFMGFIFLIKKLLHNKIKFTNLFVAISTIAIVIALYYICSYTSITSLYARSIYCFALGAIVSLYENQIITFMKKNISFIIVLVFALLLFIMAYLFLEERFIALSICILIIVIASKLTLNKNTLYTFLGEISLEIYLIQKLFFLVLPFNHVIYSSLAIIGATIISAYLLHQVYNCVRKFINLIKNNISKKNKKTPQLNEDIVTILTNLAKK